MIQKSKQLFALTHQTIDTYFGKYARIFKYIIAGGTAAAVDIGSLYIFKDKLHFTLIPAVASAFLIGFCVSFLFQKFWTFQDTTTDRLHIQAILYFLVTIISFFLNLLLMYVLVEKVHIWYIFAKIIVAGMIAFMSFFIYRVLFAETKTNSK